MNLEEILNTDEPIEEPNFSIATVGEVSADGITLVFDGSSSSGGKKYRCNSGVKFVAGDRVRIKRDSGSYLVEYPIGNPMARYPLPSGGSDGQFLAKDGSGDYSVKWVTPSTSGGLPTGGTAGQFLKKSSATDYDVEWATVSVDRIGSGTYYIDVVSETLGIALTPSSSGRVHLGTRQRHFGDLYAEGTVSLCGTGYSSTLGFFGTTPVRKQTVSTSASLSTLISALNSYGLV